MTVEFEVDTLFERVSALVVDSNARLTLHNEGFGPEEHKFMIDGKEVFYESVDTLLMRAEFLKDKIRSGVNFRPKLLDIVCYHITRLNAFLMGG